MVLHLISGRFFGGGQRVVLDLLEAQPAVGGVEARLCTLGRAEGPVGEAAEDWVEYDGRYNRLRVVYGTARSLCGVIDRLRPDVLHTHGRDADIIGAVAAARRPVRHVAHLHVTAELTPQRGPREWVKRAWIRHLWRRAETDFIAVSEAVKRFQAAHFGLDPQRIEVVRNGIRLEPFMEAGDRRRSDGRPDGERVVIGTAARLAPMKGLEGLIEAFGRLNGEVPGAVLEVAGTGKGRAELEERAGALGLAGRVRFLGHVWDMSGFYSGLDIFVLPSLSEGLPLTVLEAMASGLPVVATAVGGTPEVLRDGVDGRIVPPGDPGALKEAIAGLAREPNQRLEMGRSARERVAAGFSRERMAADIGKFYERVLHRGGSG